MKYDMEYHERMASKYPSGYVVEWVRLFRIFIEVRHGIRIPLKQCKDVFDRTHPDFVEWQKAKFEEEDGRMFERWLWVENHRKCHGCTLTESFAAHKRDMGW